MEEAASLANMTVVFASINTAFNLVYDFAEQLTLS
jgi:hypothetical protein